MKHDAKTGTAARLFPMEHISINQADGYVDADVQIDLAHGCVVVEVVAVDVSVEVVTEVVAEVVAEVGTDVGVDVVGDAAADVAADAAESGLSEATIARLRTLGLLLGGALMGTIVTESVNAVKAAIAARGGSRATSAADYWTALYKVMDKKYPCNLPASQSCGTNVRASQEAMIASFALAIAKQDPSQATAAQTFETVWPASSQRALKSALTNISNTGGIPGMIKYMETYTYPNVSGGALVIATSNTLISVADYVYTD